ncbi:MAG TPA: maleylpyruvate isomerase family mycothiol-dependent enzyme [Streptosporangiaceae bacterium]|nr:maleylpyruvate isomerase family mycothiol-dependent enzyme [Streptosporangiaceae bacterium]
MPALPAELYYAGIDASTATLAALLDYNDPELHIPTCPEWTLRQLATHVGRAHRWATQIVRTRSDQFIEFRAVPDGKLPDDQAERGRWLTAGATGLIDTLRDAGDAEVWTFNGMAPAVFWARRMAHETSVHCADGQIAAGESVEMVPELAADAIDEWFTILSLTGDDDLDARLAALPLDRTLHIHATDPDLAVGGEWMLTRSAGGVQVTPGHGKGDAALSGRAGDLLLSLLGRLPASAESIEVFGDRDVATAYQSITF